MPGAVRTPFRRGAVAESYEIFMGKQPRRDHITHPRQKILLDRKYILMYTVNMETVRRISISIRPEVLEQAKRDANACGLSLSAYIRMLVMTLAQPQVKENDGDH